MGRSRVNTRNNHKTRVENRKEALTGKELSGKSSSLQRNSCITLKGNVRDRTKNAEKRFYRRRKPDQHANILLQLRNFDDSHLVSISEPQAAWDAFYQLMWKWFDDYYPFQVVTVTSREPAFMTPYIKYLLRKNRLFKQGKIEEASAIATKIGRSIARSKSRQLRDLDSSKETKNLWRCEHYKYIGYCNGVFQIQNNSI